MTHEINLYDGYYGHLATDPQVEVRRETYGEDPLRMLSGLSRRLQYSHRRASALYPVASGSIAV
jgi:hypothetical protein